MIGKGFKTFFQHNSTVQMGDGSTSHTTDIELRNKVERIETRVDTNRLDLGRINLNFIHRPRPYPYDVSVFLTINDSGVANTFGAYTQLIPITTYDFGDVKNRVQVLGLCVCSMSANANYLVEFYKLIGGAYIPLGAVRFRRSGASLKSFLIHNPCRPFSNDETALYGRLKTSVATGENIECSLLVARYQPTDYKIPVSADAWPFG